MRGHRIMTENNTFSKEFFESEKARAIKEIENSDNFMVIYHRKGGGGGGISCVNSDHILIMSFNLDKMNKETRETVKSLIRVGAIKMPESFG